MGDTEGGVRANLATEAEAEAEARTPIQRFFSGSTVLVTGGTGFMGKVLLQKLIRTCPDIQVVHLLIRPKKGKDPDSRFDELFEDPVFAVMKEQVPKWRHKLNIVSGDCSSPSLGLSHADREMLKSDVDVVFHGAATVRFDEKLKKAMAINVNGTKQMLDLAKQMVKLKAIVHTSTAFSNSPLKAIDETFYDMSVDYNEVISIVNTVDEEQLDIMTPKILGNYPNTYIFTKAMAEFVIKKECNGLPLVIFRPSIVISTRNDPIEGWTDNFYGPTGVTVGAGTGLLRVLHGDKKSIANLVPVDMAVNALISSAWDVACNSNLNNNLKNNMQIRDADSVPIYNYVSSNDNPISWDEFMAKVEVYGLNVPTVRSIWYYSFRLVKSRMIYYLLTILLHIIPAFIMDTAIILTGGKPKLLKAYKKIHHFSKLMSYFATKTWKFGNKNVRELWNRLSEEDRKLYDFNISKLDWDNYFSTYVSGARIYILKDDMSTLPQAQIKWRRFYWAHFAVKLVLFLLTVRLLWPTMGFILSSLLS